MSNATLWWIHAYLWFLAAFLCYAAFKWDSQPLRTMPATSRVIAWVTVGGVVWLIYSAGLLAGGLLR